MKLECCVVRIVYNEIWMQMSTLIIKLDDTKLYNPKVNISHMQEATLKSGNNLRS